MPDQETLQQLQESWPETTDYLRRVGQVNNDLAVLREVAQRETYEASLTWLDQLEVSVEDLTEQSDPVLVLQFLHRRGISVPSAAQVAEYREIREEHEAQYREGWETTPEVLDGPVFSLTGASEQALLALPELQEQVLSWGQETAERHGYQGPALTLTQASILLRVVLFMEQEPESSPEWAAEYLRSALSSDFFEMAANPTR